MCIVGYNFVCIVCSQVDPVFEGQEGGPGTLIKYNPLSNVSSAEVWNFLRAMVWPFTLGWSLGPLQAVPLQLVFFHEQSVELTDSVGWLYMLPDRINMLTTTLVKQQQRCACTTLCSAEEQML